MRVFTKISKRLSKRRAGTTIEKKALLKKKKKKRWNIGYLRCLERLAREAFKKRNRSDDGSSFLS